MRILNFFFAAFLFVSLAQAGEVTLSAEQFRVEFSAKLRALANAAEADLRADDGYAINELRRTRKGEDYETCVTPSPHEETAAACKNAFFSLMDIAPIDPKLAQERSQYTLAADRALEDWINGLQDDAQRTTAEEARDSLADSFQTTMDEITQARRTHLIGVIETCDDDNVGKTIVCLFDKFELYFDSKKEGSFEKSVLVPLRKKFENAALELLKTIEGHTDRN